MTSEYRGSKVALFACMMVLFGVIGGEARTQAQVAKKNFQVTWLGHAAFEVISPGGTHILIDPWLKQNPQAPSAFKDLTRSHPAAILVTHSHFDHAQDAVEIAKNSGAPVIGSSDWVEKLPLPQKQQMGCNVGGTILIGDVTVHVVPAMHSSEPSGRPLGFVLTFPDGRSLYDTGDTWIFTDMALIEELYHPVVVLLHVGGGSWGSDPKTGALEIKKYFRPEAIVPMHFGTLPQMATESEVRAAFAGDNRLVVMIPGTTRVF